MDTRGDSRARQTEVQIKFKSSLQLSNILSILGGVLINAGLSQALVSSHADSIPGVNFTPESPGRTTVASETQQIPQKSP